MHRRQFTLEDQLRFARLSGDANPMHVDPVAARRFMYGQPVVHGIHSLLWALDRWFASTNRTVGAEIRSLRVAFLRPIVLDATVDLVVREESGSRAVLELSSHGTVVTRATVEIADATKRVRIVAARPDALPPRERRIEDIEVASGDMSLLYEPADIESLLPTCARVLAPSDIALLLASTRLVGAECPGLRSVYSELEFKMSEQSPDSEPGDAPALLQWRVTKVDARFQSVQMSIAAPFVRGSIKAFVRPAPRGQPSLHQLSSLVSPGEFAGQRALVVGGSRGLGEVATKLLAAGGASVRLTWNQGRAEAEAVAAEARASGADADALQLNVLAPDHAALGSALGDWMPTHLYYFATPNAFAGAKGAFSAELFGRYCAYYVVGLAALVPALRAAGLRAILYPSSVAVSETPSNMGEYSAAKAAGESLCTFLEKSHAGLVIHRPRFPRLDTDQTVSFLPVVNDDPAPVVLDVLRVLRDATPAGST